MKQLVLISLAFCMLQCSLRRTQDILGPDACPSENFAIVSPLEFLDHTTSSITELNLMTSHASVSVGFNEIISYRLIVTGLTSGAEFVLNGKGNSLDHSWYGNSTNGKYFMQGEMLAYKLNNLCKQEPLGTGEIRLTTIISYSGFGLKVINFEDTPPVVVSTSTPLSGETFLATVMTPSTPGYLASPQGGNYCNYVGERNTNQWYFGNQTFNGINYASLGTDPSRVYLNFFAKGKPNSQCFMDIYEGVHGQSLRRKFFANVSDQWVLYSVRLSDIGIMNPSNISGMSVQLQTALYAANAAEIDLDFVIFTFDKPF